MRKVLFIWALVVGAGLSAIISAQEKNSNLFNHLAIGASVGTPGIGLDLAIPMGNYVQMRVGIDAMPNIKYNTSLKINAPDKVTVYGQEITIPNKIDIQAKSNLFDGKLLFDFYPTKGIFHITVGAYFGSDKVMKVYNKENGSLMDVTIANKMIDVYNQTHPSDQVQKVGLELGDYLLTPDANGNVEANIQVKSFKPYTGIGIGRAVPKKSIGFMFELGCQFWGTPKVFTQGHELTSENLGGSDGGVVKNISKISVYPVLNFRLCGKLF